MEYYNQSSNNIVSKILLKWLTLILILLLTFQLSCTPPKGNARNNLGITLVLPTGSPPVDSISWSPTDKNKILVSAGDVGEGRAEIFIFDIERQEKNVIAKTNYGDLFGAWSPDGNRVLMLVGGMTKEYQPKGLWIINIADNSSEYLIDSGEASWLPDGKTIASFSIRNINTESETINLLFLDIERNTEELIYTTNTDQYPHGISWSPDGRYLIFSLGQFNTGDLYTLEIATRQIRMLTNDGRSFKPSWSPRGDIIVYERWPSSGTKSTIQLKSMNNNCDVEIPELDYVWSPTWSSDGKYIGFVGPNGIYVMEINKVLGRDIYQDLCI